MTVEETAGFRQNILDTPLQCLAGLEVARGVQLGRSFSTLVISGMGGSALPGDLLKIYLTDIESRFPEAPHTIVSNNRDYTLPTSTKNQETLHALCSYSGNTEEVLSCFHEAKAAGLAMVGISAGGELERLCQEGGIPHVKLPVPTPTFQPRMGTGYFIGAFLELLMNHFSLLDIRGEIEAESKRLLTTLGEAEVRGKELAGKLAGKTPVIYTNSTFGAVAMVWKIKINENAKTPAFWNVLPEMNHNEMVGYTLPQGPFFLVLLRDPDDHPQNHKRFGVLQQVLAERGIESEVLDMAPGSVYNKIFETLLWGDFTAYYLALAYDQDPEPVVLVETFKKML